MRRDVAVTTLPLDEGDLRALLQSACGDVGAVATFTGVVSGRGEQAGVSGLELEHYPGMTEAALHRIVDDCERRWPLQAAIVWHRVGLMSPGESSVFVGVASRHRDAEFDACRFIMDCLKTDAPFWKKEHTDQGGVWVSARQSDTLAREKWNPSENTEGDTA
jgi:molybdopterin synthase catalytic subunit